VTEKPTAILLDLDDCLYDYSKAHSAGLTASLEQLSIRLGVDAATLRVQYLKSRAEIKSFLGNTASSHSKLLYFKRALEAMGLGARTDIALELETAYWGNFIRNMDPSEGSVELLEIARELGIPVFVVTDMTLQIQIRKLISLEILTHLSGIVSSEEVGSDKPSMGFVDQLSARFDANLDCAWVIGDNIVKDGALAAALHARFLSVPTIGRRRKFFKAISGELRGL
jgi:putative hydrolase of the HAD superfamily